MSSLENVNLEELTRRLAEYKTQLEANPENSIYITPLVNEIKREIEKRENGINSEEDSSGFISASIKQDYLPATISQRVGAFIIDVIFFTILYGVLFIIGMFIFSSIRIYPDEIFLFWPLLSYLIAFYLYLFRPVLLVGSTWGKSIFGIKVVSSDDNSIGYKKVFFREIFGKHISFSFFLIGFLVKLIGFETWHDYIAGTKVIQFVDNAKDSKDNPYGNRTIKM